MNGTTRRPPGRLTRSRVVVGGRRGGRRRLRRGIPRRLRRDPPGVGGVIAGRLVHRAERRRRRPGRKRGRTGVPSPVRGRRRRRNGPGTLGRRLRHRNRPWPGGKRRRHGPRPFRRHRRGPRVLRRGVPLTGRGGRGRSAVRGSGGGPRLLGRLVFNRSAVRRLLTGHAHPPRRSPRHVDHATRPSTVKAVTASYRGKPLVRAAPHAAH